jgi:hypothetical protein
VEHGYIYQDCYYNRYPYCYYNYYSHLYFYP